MASKKFSDQFPRDEVKVGGSRTWKINVVFLASNLSCCKGGLISESFFTLALFFQKSAKNYPVLYLPKEKMVKILFGTFIGRLDIK